MSLSTTAKKLFDYLPDDGTTVGGITIRKDLDLSTPEYKAAKEELREEGLVAFGRGRGGSVARVKGKEPEEAPTPTERMAMAREVKVAKSRAKKESDTLIEKIVAYCHEEGYPQVEARDVSFYGGSETPIIMIWDTNRKNAQAHTIPQLEYDKLQAVQR